MGQSVLSPDIPDDITARMKTLKEEIKTLKNTTPPEEASTELIVNWLRAIREAPDSRAVHLLIEKVEISADKEKTDFHIVSTLESVSENLVRVVITDSEADGHIPYDCHRGSKTDTSARYYNSIRKIAIFLRDSPLQSYVMKGKRTHGRDLQQPCL